MKISAFKNAKTIFQTAEYYDPKLGIAADGVIVHRHCDVASILTPSIKSWTDEDVAVGVMFFADSDGANEYWTGKWDGTPHPDDREFNEKGDVVMCEHRPYMVPTKGWTEHLKEKVNISLECGAMAIMPEEPLAHTYSGYSESFKKLWEGHYGFPWQAQSSSALAQFLTAELKAILYLNLEKNLLKTAKEKNEKADFIIPIHSIFGNISSYIVAPLGMSVGTEDVDGYIGQIWTGPINWSLSNYESAEKSFFASAYALYDYFTQLTVGTDKKLWLLVDPVEDDPNHTWNEFAEWYKHSVAAMLLMSGIDTYEIMPWPDRMFMPGHETGGGTPAPEDFRMRVLTISQVLQDIPKGGEWLTSSPTKGIAVAVADTAMYQKRKVSRTSQCGTLHKPAPQLQGLYGMLIPLINRGIPVSSFVMERAQDKDYADLYKVVILSYEEFKPIKPEMNIALAEWVKRGGSLIIFGNAGDELDKDDYFWWRKIGFESPLEHLLAQFKKGYGKGNVIHKKISASEFADSKSAAEKYLPLVEAAVNKSDISGKLETPGNFCMKRGEYVIAHSLKEDISLEGKFIDIFDTNLPVIDNIDLKQGESGLYKDISENLKCGKIPVVLQTSFRLISQEYENGELKFIVKGPAETPAVARLFLAGKENIDVTAVNSRDEKTAVEVQNDGETYLLKFPNCPKGVTVIIR